MDGYNCWGKDGRKCRVICFYCGEECRKDNLKRHTNTKHYGQPPKSKINSVEGQKQLNFFKIPPSEAPRLNIPHENNNVNVVESIRDPNLISNSIPPSSEISNSLLQIETEVKAKKRKTAEVKSTDTATDLVHYFVAFETNIKEFIN